MLEFFLFFLTEFKNNINFMIILRLRFKLLQYSLIDILEWQSKIGKFLRVSGDLGQTLNRIKKEIVHEAPLDGLVDSFFRGEGCAIGGLKGLDLDFFFVVELFNHLHVVVFGLVLRIVVG